MIVLSIFYVILWGVLLAHHFKARSERFKSLSKLKRSLLIAAGILLSSLIYYVFFIVPIDLLVNMGYDIFKESEALHSGISLSIAIVQIFLALVVPPWLVGKLFSKRLVSLF